MNADMNTRLDTVVILAVLFLISSAMFILAFVNIPDKNQTLFAALVGGVIGASLSTYVSYRWGSSKGSSVKDDTISQLMTKVSDK